MYLHKRLEAEENNFIYANIFAFLENVTILDKSYELKIWKTSLDQFHLCGVKYA